jgi:hypothetical protein
MFTVFAFVHCRSEKICLLSEVHPAWLAYCLEVESAAVEVVSQHTEVTFGKGSRPVLKYFSEYGLSLYEFPCSMPC